VGLHLPPQRVGESPDGAAHPYRDRPAVTQLDRGGLQHGGHLAGYSPRGDPGIAVDELGDQVECSGLCGLTITAGVDVRTVAGRLGHGGGGTTTLRVYTVWVSESDQRASARLVSRMPLRPAEEPAELLAPAGEPRHPYEVVALSLRDEIVANSWQAGERLPSIQTLARGRAVSAATVQRAVKLLAALGLRPGQAGLWGVRPSS